MTRIYIKMFLEVKLKKKFKLQNNMEDAEELIYELKLEKLKAKRDKKIKTSTNGFFE